MKRATHHSISMALLFVCIFFATGAHANIIEQILNNPKIQALLGKPAEIVSQSQQCKNTNFRLSNAQLCTDVDNAEIASKMPMEMRTVMMNRVSAQALRDLCLVAVNAGQPNNYLCVELVKADKDFAAVANSRGRGGSGITSTNDLSN
jgi:Na+/H+ antiporter NhaB